MNLYSWFPFDVSFVKTFHYLLGLSVARSCRAGRGSNSWKRRRWSCRRPLQHVMMGPFPAIAYHNDVYNDVCMDIRGWMDGWMDN